MVHSHHAHASPGDPSHSKHSSSKESSRLFMLNKSDIRLVKVDWSTVKRPDLIWFVLK